MRLLNYRERKPMSADHLSTWIQFDQIRAVAEQEPALADLLKALKLVE